MHENINNEWNRKHFDERRITNNKQFLLLQKCFQLVSASGKAFNTGNKIKSTEVQYLYLKLIYTVHHPGESTPYYTKIKWPQVSENSLI